MHVLTGISSLARPLAHTRGVRPAVYLLCACCLREMASLVLRVDVRVYTCSKTRNGCWPWPEGVTLAPPKSTWEQPHPGRSRDLKTWVLEMKPGNCTKPGFSTRFSMLRMDPKSPDSGRRRQILVLKIAKDEVVKIHNDVSDEVILLAKIICRRLPHRMPSRRLSRRHAKDAFARRRCAVRAAHDADPTPSQEPRDHILPRLVPTIQPAPLIRHIHEIE